MRSRQAGPVLIRAAGAAPVLGPETDETAKVIGLALPLLEEAAGARVEAVAGDADPFIAVQAPLESSRFDEVIVSMLPHRASHWLRLDRPARIERLGVPRDGRTTAQSDRACQA
jgi:hypothetical protein